LFETSPRRVTKQTASQEYGKLRAEMRAPRRDVSGKTRSQEKPGLRKNQVSGEPAMAAVTQDDVLSALKQCYAPEIPVNIVDLGLIYNVQFQAVPEDRQDVTVEMTLTAQGCPEHVNISAQVKARVEQLPGVRNATVNVVWNPPWGPERLSPEARKQLGIE
jgi:metal-sulfur cluster biosynthetic enzyme